jgi:AMMECR1 domain-containing protein
MANPRTRSLAAKESAVVAGALDEPLSARARRVVAEDVRRLLHWQASLAGWRGPRSAVDAIPFVALYAHGTLRACMGSAEGPPRGRLTRAFLSALGDVRFGGVRPGDRAGLTAEVSFMRRPRTLSEDSLLRELELGTHGIGLARDAGVPVFLLPTVARDSRLDAAGMLAALLRKAGPTPGTLFLFEADRVVVRPREARPSAAPSPRDHAAAWLASLVRPDGSVIFARDALTGESAEIGKMHHARAANVVQALAAHGGYEVKLKRARARLLRDARAALGGRNVAGWPTHPAEIAGTLALLVRAGIPLRAETLAYATASHAALCGIVWHAGQVAAALGRDTPGALWDACVHDLERQPWAPWTVLALHARRESATRAVLGLVAAVREGPPYEGAVVMSKLPEVAVTAITAEGLALYPNVPGARSALRRARAFVLRQQLTEGTIPGPYATKGTLGAFLAAPTASILRGDVTAHALLALP